MKIAQNRLMTLEEYLNYDDGTDTVYELIDGVLVEKTTGAGINIVIGSFLFSIFLQFVPYYCIRQGTQIVVKGKHANTRIPNLMILSEEGSATLLERKWSVIRFEMPQPILVVEVVSISDTSRASRERDYTRKKEEYAQREIAEYWIVDPILASVWVLTLMGDRYQETKFVGDDWVRSLQFPKLKLSAKQILEAGIPS